MPPDAAPVLRPLETTVVFTGTDATRCAAWTGWTAPAWQAGAAEGAALRIVVRDTAGPVPTEAAAPGPPAAWVVCEPSAHAAETAVAEAVVAAHGRPVLALVDALDARTLDRLHAAGADDAAVVGDPEMAAARLRAMLRRHRPRGGHDGEESGRLRMMYEAMTEFIGICRPDGTLVEANRASLAAIGARSVDVVGRKFWDTPWWSSSAELRERLRAAMAAAARGEPARFVAEHPGVDGTIHVDFNLVPVRGPDGAVVAIVPEGKDVTEAVVSQRRLQTSSDTLAAVLATLREGVVFQSPDGQIRFANDAAHRILALDADAAVGRDSNDPRWQVLREDGTPWPGEDHPAMVALRSGRPVRDQVMGVMTPQGERVWIRVNAQPVPSSEGSKGLAGVVTSFFDVTERMARSRALEASQALLQRVTEHMPLAFWRFDRLGAIVHANAAARRLMPGADYAGRTLAEIGVSPAIVQAHAEDTARALAGTPTERLLSVPHDGVETALRIVTLPDVGASGDVVGTFGFGVDVTLEQQRVAREQEAALLAERLIGIVSHDLRSPLQAMSLATAMLKRDAALSPASQRAVDRLTATQRRATRLVSDLLDFALARAGVAIPVVRAAGDLRETLDAAVEEARANAPRHALELELAGDPAAVFDADRIAQLLGNLLANAVRHGDVHAPIVVRLDGDADEVVLSVCNAGRTIDERDAASIFEPLKRGGLADGANVAKSLGLGLFIVREIARAHGGEVSVHSADGRTRFTTRWPRR